MRSVFALFSEIDKAKIAVNSLINRDVSIKDVNTVVQSSIARLFLDIRREEIKAEVSSYLGKTTMSGLERLLAGIRPVNTQDAGKILAAGEAGSILGKAAEYSPVKKANSFQKALEDFGFSQNSAALYREKIAGGELMLWVRSSDNRVPELINVLRDFDAHDIVTVQ